MNSFEIEIDDKSRVGSEFMARVVNEIRRALSTEKAKRKITQQSIADTIGTSRSVINRQVQGFENLSARRIAEILWAIGWEPHFEARPIPDGDNASLPPTPLTKLEPKEEKETASALAEASKGFRQSEPLQDEQMRSLAQDNAYSRPKKAANG